MNRIKQLRKALNLTQVEFAKKIGQTCGSISNYENGKYNPSASVLRLIASEYKVNLEWLKTGDGEMFKADERMLSERDKLIIERISKLSEEYQAEVIRVLKSMLSE